MGSIFLTVAIQVITMAQVYGIEVSLDDGTKIIGSMKTTPLNKKVKEFTGIPYAEPPIGRLRFRAPLSKRPSITPINATVEPPSCMQTVGPIPADLIKNFWTPKIYEQMSEDCLYLNIWVPGGAAPNSSLPVMIWIHGGGFFSGSSMVPIYNGQILATEQNVIVVSMNYRVSLFGFLTTDHSDVLGNAGMLDQLMAIKWVHKNIASFGGDPNRVTLFGESAGAASAGFHVLSTQSRLYFHRVIMQSGSPTATWAFNNRHEMIERTLKVANAVNCTSVTQQNDAKSPNHKEWADIIECMTNQSPMTLLANSYIPVHPTKMIWTPTVDGYFLTDHPVNLLKYKKYPHNEISMIIGTNMNEANLLFPMALPDIYRWDLIKNTSDIITSETMLNHILDRLLPAEFQHQAAKQAILFEYKNWSLPETSINRQQTAERLFTDYQFVCPAKQMADAFNDWSDVYVYNFGYHSITHSTPRWMGTVHSDEIPFIFGVPLNMSDYNYWIFGQLLSKRIMNYWANFARSGNPNEGPIENHAAGWTLYSKDLELRKIIGGARDPDRGAITRRACTFWHQTLPNLMKFIYRSHPYKYSK